MSVSSDFYIVGIGASAGGLRALEELFAALPADCGLAFVIVQHLPADSKSELDKLLGRYTPLPIHFAADGMALAPNSVYVSPPGQDLTLRDRCLYLAPVDRDSQHPHFPIDIFLESLAQDCQSQAIGAILSGTGSDGSQGLASLREQGGHTFVQAPQTAAFDGMPHNALLTGAVDRALAPSDIARAICELAASPAPPDLPAAAPKELPAEFQDARTLQHIVTLLATTTGSDFSGYKPGTLCRQILRRSAAAGYDSVAAYSQYLETSPAEREQLRGDLLVSVTQFFRDKPAWEYLEREVIPMLFERIAPGEQLRLWVTACATGEEAYSLAISIDEAQQRLQRDVRVKIFATDIDAAALARASEGKYPTDIARDVSGERLQRYFISRDRGYEVARRLRGMVVFSQHDLIKNVMLGNMHLICCRNVSIYLQPALQRQVFRDLHFALGTRGILFLGSSESLGDIDTEFTTLEPKWKIFEKRRDVRLSTRLATAVSPTADRLAGTLPSADLSPGAPNFDPRLDRACARFFTAEGATCFLVDAENNLLHLVADPLNLLRIPSGRMTANIISMVAAPLQLPLRTALLQARQNDTAVELSDIECSAAILQLRVFPQARDERAEAFLVVDLRPQVPDRSGRDRPAIALPDAQTGTYIFQLERDLQLTRENLQTTIAKLETANQQLQGSNEELITSNEELQNTNEELHSVNEELHFVNAENQSRIQQLTELNADLDNLLQNTNIGVVFLDANLNVRKFTPIATTAINLRVADIGRPLHELSTNIDCPELIELIHLVEESALATAQEVKLVDSDRYLLLQIHPYRLQDGAARGTVLTFVDIDDLKQAEAEVRDSEARLRQTNEILEQRVIDRTHELTYLSYSLRQLHWIATQSYDRLEVLLQNYLVMGLNILDLSHGIISQATGKAHTIYTSRSDLAALAPGTKMRARTIYCQEAIARRETVARARVSDDPALCEDPAYQELRLESYIATPIFVRKKLYGTLTLAATTPRAADFTQYEREIIELVAQDIGTAIERDRTQAEIRRSEERYELVVRGSGVGIWDLDLQTWQMTFSARHHEIQGYAADSKAIASHEDYLQHIHPDDRDAAIEALEAHLLYKEPYNIEYRLRRAASDYVWVRDEGQAVWGEIGDPVRMAGSIQNISTQKEYELRLQRTNAELVRATRLKDEFLANMSHELRTPLNAILGLSETLEEDILGPINAGQRKALKTIRSSGEHLLALIEDILDVAKIEAGQLELRLAPTDVCALCQGSLAFVKQQAQKKRLHLDSNVPPQLPKVLLDERRVRQAIVNLLDNAVKFTPAGGSVKLKAEILPPSAAQAAPILRLTVTDTGIGIAPEDQEKLFQPFVQVDSALNRQYDGSGLGLHLVKQIAELHGGTAGLRSEPNVGSHLWIDLPYQDSAGDTSADAVAPTSPEQLEVSQRGATILVVEDHHPNVESLQANLGNRGYRMLIANNGEEGIAIARERHPDLILMDIQMPVMDGLEAIKILRGDPQFENLPIVALTALAMPDDGDRCMAAGATEYVTKPVRFRQLVATIERLLAAGDRSGPS